MAHEHGLLSLVGWQQGGLRLVDMELWNWKALDVLNVHERRMDYLMDCMRRGLTLIAHGSLNLGALVSPTSRWTVWMRRSRAARQAGRVCEGGDCGNAHIS